MQDDSDEFDNTAETDETVETFEADHRTPAAPVESLAEQLMDDAGIEHAALEDDRSDRPAASTPLTDSSGEHATGSASQLPVRTAAGTTAAGTTAAAVIEIGGPETSTGATESRRPETSPRPVRNLFTLLRRKQQGRL